MKSHKRTLFAILLSAALTVFMAAAVYAEQAKAISVDAFVGKVEYRIGKAAWKTAGVGDQIPANAEIRVKAAGDSADLIMPDGSIVKLGGGTQKTVSDIIAENAKSKTVKNNKVIKPEVETETGVASVRGNLAEAGNSLSVASFIGSCEYRMGEGDWLVLKVGDKVPENAEIRVNGKNDSLELNYPDGSVIELFGLTSVRVADIAKNKNGKKSSFISLLAGKIFAKVNRADEQDFQVETLSGVASVRGTKFGVSFLPGTGGVVVVSEGSVAVIDPLGKFQPTLIQKGFMSMLSGMAGKAPSAPQAAPLNQIQEFDPDYKPETGAASSSQSSASSEPSQQQTPEPAQVKTTGAESGDAGFNFGLAAENIDGKVWNKMVLSPVFKFGNFALALYVPVYFQNLDDLIAPDRWYNYYEWNFTTWSSALQSILLKIRYVQFQNDNVLFKLGNIPDFTIGHGSLVDTYANDLEFPSKRRVGIQLNLDFGQWGFESMVGDVFLTKLFAGRVFTRPLFGLPVIGNLGVGVSAFIDQDPLYNNQSKAFGFSADLDMPIYKLPMVGSMTAYMDAATLGYADGILNTNQFMKGLGLFAGLKGTIVVIDYKAEYRRIQGGFIPNYVDKFYDVNRVARYALLAYTTAPNFNGFLISAGKTFEGVGGVLLSYQHYFSETASTNINNNFHMEASISKKLFKKAYGLIAYDRMNFAFGDLFTSFLGNGAVITTEVHYEMAPGAYIGITAKKYFQTDAVGNIQEKYTVALTTDIGL